MVDSLIEGLSRFRANAFPELADRFGHLATGQSPDVLVVTCADSRIDPSLLTQSGPGEIFVVRNAGNIVPPIGPSGSSADSTAASVEYALSALKVGHVVVCGHSGCGAMTGLADLASLTALPSVAAFLEHSRPALESVDGADLDRLIEANVLLQLDHVATYPGAAEAISSGRLSLHGWVYDIGSGEVRGHDRSTDTWAPLNP